MKQIMICMVFLCVAFSSHVYGMQQGARYYTAAAARAARETAQRHYRDLMSKQYAMGPFDRAPATETAKEWARAQVSEVIFGGAAGGAVAVGSALQEPLQDEPVITDVYS